MLAMKNMFDDPTPKFLKEKEQKYNNTYRRYNKELKSLEMLGYGGENESMWTNAKQYFERTEREDSIFGKQILVLKTVCWMNPYACIEHIPADWAIVNVVIYHSYQNGFRMNNKLNIKLTPMSHINEKDCFTEVYNT